MNVKHISFRIRKLHQEKKSALEGNRYSYFKEITPKESLASSF